MSTVDRPPSDLPARIDGRLGAGFAILHRILIAAVALVLVVLAAMALWNTATTVETNLARHELSSAVTQGVDAVFLTIILLELLHTVITREPLAQQAEDFIVIGLTSAIRYGLGVVATASGSDSSPGATTHHLAHIPVSSAADPRDTVINLAINSASVLLLVAALWLVRHQFGPLHVASIDE